MGKLLIICILTFLSINSYASELDVIDNPPEIVLSVDKNFITTIYPDYSQIISFKTPKTVIVFHSKQKLLKPGMMVKYLLTADEDTWFSILDEVHVYDYDYNMFK